MSVRTLTRADICDQLTSSVKLSRQQATDVLETVLEGIAQGLTDQGCVKISSFGTFYVRQKNQRMGRNPKTGEEVPIASRRSLSFRASNVLRQKVGE